MPAHTAAWQVGVTRKGDGSKLTAADRKGNDLADSMAKKGAKPHRVPARIRSELEVAERVALRAALQLGITTNAANNVPETIFKPDGSSSIKMARDSNGAPRGSTLRRARIASPRPSREVKKVVKTSTLLKAKEPTLEGPKAAAESGRPRLSAPRGSPSTSPSGLAESRRRWSS